MFYRLPKCEVNLATFEAAAQSEKLQSSSTPKKRLKEVKQPFQYCKCCFIRFYKIVNVLLMK